MSRWSHLPAAIIIVTLALSFSIANARNPIRRDFFDAYPSAESTQLDNLPGNSGHCGVCHIDFDGGGARNPYGLAIEVGISGGMTITQAILAAESSDVDNDGYSSLIEITDTVNFGNTPTFPGLSLSNAASTLNIPYAEIEPYLTPSGGSDTIAPEVTVLSPNGSESISANDFYNVDFIATDASGIAHINLYFSDDGGNSYKPVGRQLPPISPVAWYVPNRPTTSGRLLIEAVDNAGNPGTDLSDDNFILIGAPPGFVPTTLRDVDLSGTQPHEGAILDDADVSCSTCHGNYDQDHEAWFNWRGSMMSQAARDPLYLACLAVAEQDAPSVGDLCIRCHFPGGWQEGRSVDTSGALMTAKDRQGVQCDYCHREVDHIYIPGVSPVQDQAVLATVNPLPMQYGNGQFISDPAPLRRGPYADANASHAFVESPLHRSSNLCGRCHDVSNPVFVQVGEGDYAPNTFDAEHPDMQVRNMFPVERTFSEWSVSEYATTGVYAPQFAGNKPDGIVSTCQDCHMRDVQAYGCSENGAPLRDDLGLHDFTGGNTFVPEMIPDFYPDEVDQAQLSDAIERAGHMLQLAASLELIPEEFGLTVRVTNETGHKLPSGYPEGRRIWLHVEAFDIAGQPVYESGHYDDQEALLTHDEHLKVYEIHQGLSAGLAGALGVDSGPTFHFVISDTVFHDNRIPPRGFTQANFAAVQSPPVDHHYEDGQYWDDTAYTLPSTADSVFVTLYYQTTTREYVEFLRDENTTNSAGDDLHASWVAHGMSPPVEMVSASAAVEVSADVTDEPDSKPFVFALAPNAPNPVATETQIRYSLANRAAVDIAVYDVSGRRLRTLVSETKGAGEFTTVWDGRDDNGIDLSNGIYFLRYKSDNHHQWRKMTLLK